MLLIMLLAFYVTFLFIEVVVFAILMKAVLYFLRDVFLYPDEKIMYLNKMFHISALFVNDWGWGRAEGGRGVGLV